MEKKQLSKKQKVLSAVIWAFIMFWIIGLIIGDSDTSSSSQQSSNKNQTNSETAKENAISINASDLYLAYDENEVNADNLYKGKLVNVAGIVDSIGKDILDDPYITLKTDTYSSVQCFLNKEDINLAATLKEDQPIVMQGRVDGYLMNVIVKSCRIIAK